MAVLEGRQVIDVGDLDRRITIKVPTHTQNPNTGAVRESWAEHEVWAMVEYTPRRQVEMDAKSMEISFQEIRFTVHYNSLFEDRECVVVYKGLDLDVISTMELGRKQFLRLIIEQRA